MTQENIQQDDVRQVGLGQGDLRNLMSHELVGWTVAPEPPEAEALVSLLDTVSSSMNAFKQRHQAMQDAREISLALENTAAQSVSAQNAVPGEVAESVAAEYDHIVLVNAPDAAAHGGGADAKVVVVSGFKSQVIGMQG